MGDLDPGRVPQTTHSSLVKTFDERGHGNFLCLSSAFQATAPSREALLIVPKDDDMIRSEQQRQRLSCMLLRLKGRPEGWAAGLEGADPYASAVTLLRAEPWWRQGLAARPTPLEAAQRRLCAACALLPALPRAVADRLGRLVLVSAPTLLPAAQLLLEASAGGDPAEVRRRLEEIHSSDNPGSADSADAMTGKTAVYLAAERNHTAALAILVSNGANMNAPDRTDTVDSPLVAAARHGSKDALLLLLECGVDWCGSF